MEDLEHDWEAYRILLHLWSSENPIKTIKLQVLLAVNALLVSAVAIAGGRWYLYLAGAVFCFVWTLSIGRTALFQNLWQSKLAVLRARHPGDARFAVLDTVAERHRAPRLLALLGGVSSKWYLVLSPLLFGVAWLAVLAVALLGR